MVMPRTGLVVGRAYVPPVGTAGVCLPGAAGPLGSIEGLWDPVHDPSCMGLYRVVHSWLSYVFGHWTAAWPLHMLPSRCASAYSAE